jgi:hypothetical protein
MWDEKANVKRRAKQDAFVVAKLEAVAAGAIAEAEAAAAAAAVEAEAAVASEKRPLQFEGGWGQNISPRLWLLNCVGSTTSERTCPKSLLFESQFFHVHR